MTTQNTGRTMCAGRSDVGLLEALILALVWIVVIVIIGALILWAIGQYGPAEVQKPAKLIIGGVILIAILLILLRVLVGAMPPLP